MEYLNEEQRQYYVARSDSPINFSNSNDIAYPEQAPKYLKNLIAKMKGMPKHDRDIWIKRINEEFAE
ncbi:hypothetical protein JXA27_06640 [Aerococcaceae bacterium zg-B36]|uniref:hypothetical protein n=1 Tax=Aerococcaceae bacterium zg-252 TaxID=2796928 RepID=UPI001BD85A01|nr:hypothetical protein [Aerococcaceae bacterium zg-B36]